MEVTEEVTQTRGGKSRRVPAVRKLLADWSAASGDGVSLLGWSA